VTRRKPQRQYKGLTMSDARLMASARAAATKEHKRAHTCPVCGGPKLLRLIACSRPCIDTYNAEHWSPK
jgi:predicted RNA-binding Zn-ribbon protein involved in translation (DUF1610 family)